MLYHVSVGIGVAFEFWDSISIDGHSYILRLIFYNVPNIRIFHGRSYYLGDSSSCPITLSPDPR